MHENLRVPARARCASAMASAVSCNLLQALRRQDAGIRGANRHVLPFENFGGSPRKFSTFRKLLLADQQLRPPQIHGGDPGFVAFLDEKLAGAGKGRLGSRRRGSA